MLSCRCAKDWQWRLQDPKSFIRKPRCGFAHPTSTSPSTFPVVNKLECCRCPDGQLPCYRIKVCSIRLGSTCSQSPMQFITQFNYTISTWLPGCGSQLDTIRKVNVVVTPALTTSVLVPLGPCCVNDIRSRQFR